MYLIYDFLLYDIILGNITFFDYHSLDETRFI